MQAWVALFKKDFKLTRSVFLAGLAMNVLMVMLTMYLGMKTEHNVLMLIPLSVAVVLHVVYVPVMVWISIRIEARQLHLWLHNPNPALTLLFSKLANGILMVMISLLMLYVMSGLLVIPGFNVMDIYGADIWKSASFAFPHIIIVSIMFAVWTLFLWAIFQSLRFRIGRWSWAVVLGAVVIPGWVAAQFESTQLYRLMTKWGTATYHFPSFTIDPIQIHAGEYVYNLILIIGLFILTAWIIDNKVEV